jgi:hypothetical protein
VRTMARYRKKRGGSRKAKSIPIAVAAPLIMVGAEAASFGMKGDWKNVGYIFTGVDASGKFQGSRVARTYLPMAAGIVVHKVANKVGVNNIVRRATMGFLSI